VGAQSGAPSWTQEELLDELAGAAFGSAANAATAVVRISEDCRRRRRTDPPDTEQSRPDVRIGPLDFVSDTFLRRHARMRLVN
jgi:hypothetical protein